MRSGLGILSRLCVATFIGAIPAAAESALISGTVTRIVDGDTLDLGVVRIRLHGIDAPETGQTCLRENGRSWQCGTAATNRLAELAEGKRLTCEALDRDLYGRIIARCRHEGVDINGVMIDEGLAWAFVRFSNDYSEQEAMARKAGVGLWQGEAQPAWDYRDDRWARAVATSPHGCPIKGNINRGERIYHTPWSPVYDRTVITEDDGERWFCSEGEAQAAGWRSPYWR